MNTCLSCPENYSEDVPEEDTEAIYGKDWYCKLDGQKKGFVHPKSNQLQMPKPNGCLHANKDN